MQEALPPAPAKYDRSSGQSVIRAHTISITDKQIPRWNNDSYNGRHQQITDRGVGEVENQPQSQTEAIALSQLADLVQLDPTWFSQHRAELPAPAPMRDGSQGRPQLCYSLEQLAELIIARTGFMTEVEARLRLALAPAVYRVQERSPSRTNLRKLGPFRLIEVNGEHVVVPQDLDRLSADDRAEAEAALAHEALRVDPVNRRPYTAKDHRHE